MARRHLLIALAALGLTGCWTRSCVSREAGVVVETCHEYLVTVFDDLQASDALFCSGVAQDGSCSANGYSYSCGNSWVRPADAALAACR